MSDIRNGIPRSGVGGKVATAAGAAGARSGAGQEQELYGIYPQALRLAHIVIPSHTCVVQCCALVVHNIFYPLCYTIISASPFRLPALCITAICSRTPRLSPTPRPCLFSRFRSLCFIPFFPFLLRSVFLGKHGQ